MFSNNLSMRVSSRPANPPPSVNPQYSPFLKNTGPEYIRQYIKSFVYIWTRYKNSFWFYPVDFAGDNAFGYAWDGSDWKYITIKIDQIDCIY